MADDFSEKLNAVLSNPDAMGQIMSLAQSLGGGGASESAEAPSPQAAQATVVPDSPAPFDLSGILNMVGGLIGGGGSGGGNPLADLDPRLVQLGLRLFSEYGREDDRKTALLTALRPFLKEDRAAKIDRAARAAKLARLARVAFQMFREGRGEDV